MESEVNERAKGVGKLERLENPRNNKRGGHSCSKGRGEGKNGREKLLEGSGCGRINEKRRDHEVGHTNL